MATTTDKKVVKAGGTKGQAIILAMMARPDATRQQIADKADATTGRVGEVVRYLALHGTKEEKQIVKPWVAKTPAKSAPTAKKAAAKAPAKKTPAKAPAKKAPAKSTPTPRKQAEAKGVITEMEDALRDEGIASPLR